MTEYCAPADIAANLQLMEKGGESRLTFDGDSKPSLEEVNGWIEDIEDWIDDYTLDSWRSVTVPNEMHRGERRSNVIGYGIPRSHIIYLTHKNITKPFVSGTDKLEIAENNDWIDLVDVGNGEGVVYGDKDFYIDQEKGRIYVYGRYIKIGPGTVRVTYRHGHTAVKRPIKRACVLLVSMRFLSGDDYINLFPDNPNNIQLQSKYANFKEEAYQILERYRRVITI